MKILLTGAAGFIGMHTAFKLLERGDEVVGLDSLNDYYDPALKQARLKQLQLWPKFRFIKADVADAAAVMDIFAAEKPQRVIHLAAQAGVRYSLTNPQAYIQSNLVGFANILEGCRHHHVEHLVYASSSSVYGGNTKVPFSVSDQVDHPVSLYAATKKANELMAHSYSHLYCLPTTGLRYFTVYGPWGRPDMAPWLFTEAILQDRPINVFNHGQMQRDFTYVDDIAEGTVRVLDHIAKADATFDASAPHAGSSLAPYRVYNIGNNQPVQLLKFIEILEMALGKKARLNLMPMQAGDVVATYANLVDLVKDIKFNPEIDLQNGLLKWVDWYRDYADFKIENNK
jgi:UDP-glucuronate 4-epimerase